MCKNYIASALTIEAESEKRKKERREICQIWMVDVKKIRDYLKEHNLTMATLAVQYSMTRQDVTNILNGKLKNPQANQFIARVIEDFKIR